MLDYFDKLCETTLWKGIPLLKRILLMMVMNLPVFFIVRGYGAVESVPGDAGLPAHHTSKGFRNLYSDSNRAFGDLLKWQLGLGPHEPPPISPNEIQFYRPAVVEPELSRIKHPDSDRIQITWVGHSTFLIQMDGVN